MALRGGSLLAAVAGLVLLTSTSASTPLCMNSLKDGEWSYYLLGEQIRLKRVNTLLMLRREQMGGAQSLPLLGKALTEVGWLFADAGIYFEAAAYFQRALETEQRIVGINGKALVQPLYGLAYVYRMQGRLGDAEHSAKRARQILEQEYGPDHVDVAFARGWLADVYQDQGRHAEAADLYERAIATITKTQGPDGTSVAALMSRLAWHHKIQGDLVRAEELLSKALKIEEKAANEDVDALATINYRLGVFYQDTGKLVEAESYYMQALSIRDAGIRKRPEKHVLSAVQTFDALGTAQQRLGRTADAERSFGCAVSLLEALREPVPYAATVFDNLAKLYASQGRTSDAEALLKKSKKASRADTKELLITFGSSRRREEVQGKTTFGTERGEILAFGQAVIVAGRDLVTGQGSRRVTGAGELDRSLEPLSPWQLLTVLDLKVSATLRGVGDGVRSHRTAPLLFVHGFNVSFDDALKQAAQIAFDLGYPGVLAFTWPASHGVLGYARDQDSAEIAANYLVDFIDALAAELPQKRLSIIAHSMGARVVLAALEKFALRNKDNGVKIDAIVLAHPDIDRDRFRQLLPSISRLGSHITMYVSRDDRALLVSKLLRGVNRAGGEVLVAPGVETIDVTGLGASWWRVNHDLYSSNPILFTDISRLLRKQGVAPHERTLSFEQIVAPEGTYWRYRTPRINPIAEKYNDLGMLLYANKKYGSAIAKFSVAIKVEPTFATAYYNRNLAYIAMHQFELAARDHIEGIIQATTAYIKPGDYRGYSARGQALLEKGEYEKAIDDLTQAIDLPGGNAGLYGLRGWAFAAKRDYEKAVTDLTRYIEWREGRPDWQAVGYADRGRAQLYKGALAEAVKDLEKANELAPENASIALWLDIVHRRSKLPSRLKDTSKRLDMTAWPAPVIRLFLGELTTEQAREAGKHKDRAEQYWRACEMTFYTGQLELLRGSRDASARLFRSALQQCKTFLSGWDGWVWLGPTVSFVRYAAHQELMALGLRP